MRPQPLIAVHDVEASSRWYQQVFGCESAHGGPSYERLTMDGALVLQLHRFAVKDHHRLIADPNNRPYGNGDLLSEVPTAIHVEYYAKAVAEAAVRWRLITAGGEITALAYDEAETLDATPHAAEQKIFAISRRQRGADFVALSVVAQQYFDPHCWSNIPRIMRVLYSH